jgi:dihydroorotase
MYLSTIVNLILNLNNWFINESQENIVNILFKNIRAISPAQNLDQHINILMKKDKISYAGQDMPEIDSETEVIDGNGLIASPGLFDMHVHLREPGYEYKEDIKSGSESAANGGFTGVLCMPNTDPVIDNAVVVEYVKQKAKGLLTDIHIAAALTQNSDGKQISPMMELDEAGVLMFTDDGRSVESSEVMRTIFDYAGTKDLLISQHCEDTHLTKNFAMNEGVLSDKLGLKGYPYIAEEIMIARDIMLAEYCGRRRYHVSHISTNGAVRIIKEAKSRGLRITCEVTPHHFSLTDSHVETYNTNYKMNPPLRRKRDIDAILEGLIDGTIDCIATDHAPHALHEKDVEYEVAPNGIVGLETALGITLTNLYHTGILNIVSVIEKMSVNPRRILGLPEIKIEKGEKANLSIFSPDEEWSVDIHNFKSKSNNSPYHGYKLKGKPKYSINNGKIIKSSL